MKQLKELEILKLNMIVQVLNEENRVKLNEAIKELEELQSNINTSIEEIEYALAKPMYADVYLNNALRYLKERV